jgi:hypothetical protein
MFSETEETDVKILPQKKKIAPKVIKLSSGLVKHENEPRFIVNGRETELRNVKPIELKDMSPEEKLKTALMNAKENVLKSEKEMFRQELEKKEFDQIESMWKALQLRFNNVELPNMDDRSFAGLAKYRKLYEMEIKKHTKDTVAFYKVCLVIVCASIEYAAEYFEYDMSGFAKIHLQNLYKYQGCFEEMAIVSGGNTVLESCSPMTRLITWSVMNTLLFFVCKYFFKLNEIDTLKVSSNITGLMNGELDKANIDPSLNIMGFKVMDLFGMAKSVTKMTKQDKSGGVSQTGSRSKNNSEMLDTKMSEKKSDVITPKGSSGIENKNEKKRKSRINKPLDAVKREQGIDDNIMQ